jgi:aminopeptidase N
MESIVPPRKPKKKIEEMTSEELLKFVFPNKKVRDELKRIANAERPKRKKKS